MSSGRRSLGEKAAFYVLKMRRQFFKMSMREKILALLFAFALVGVWFSFQMDRHSSVSQAIEIANSEAKGQRLWIDQETSIRANYDSMISEINLEELPSQEEVGSRIDTMLRSYNFGSFNLGSAKTVDGEGLRFHTIPFEIKKGTFADIRKFTEEFKKTLPYVSLERIIIRPQTKDDQYVDVNYILKVIEYAK